MGEWTRRRFLQGCTAAAAAAVTAPWSLGAGERASAASTQPVDPSQAYLTCFYQFGKVALAQLSGPKGLPNGPQYLHVFSHSFPGHVPRPETAKAVHACGGSFRFAPAFDLHKYKGWVTASDDQLRAWAADFRKAALIEGARADYFAFNELPTTAPDRPEMRAAAAKICRFLHDAGDGLGKLRGVFYFTERNLGEAPWQGDERLTDEFWAALDETCDLVVGEHYHNYAFVTAGTPEQYAEHLFALPRRLAESGRSAQVNVARNKYAVLHSTYYGPKVTGWAGLRTDKHTVDEVRNYLDRVIGATRASPFGQQRIAFGPLAAQDYDNRMIAPLAASLGREARRFRAAGPDR